MIVVNDSERLSYALMGDGDGDLMFELDQDVAVMKYINGGKVTTRQEIDEVFLPRMAAYKNAKKGWGLWKVMLKDNNAFIGWILVRPMNFFANEPAFENLELGWRFKQSSWGKGYGTEAALQVMLSLKAAGVKQFSAIAFAENIGSINIMKKLGMQYLKTELHQDPLGDEVVDFYEVKY